MKRDMDLVRHLLLALEEKHGPELMQAAEMCAQGYSVSEVQYHLNLMFQAGLINGEDLRSTTSNRLIKVMPFDLTWQGHEFLEAVRDPEVWRQAKAGASKAGTAGIEFVWGMAKVLLKTPFASARASVLNETLKNRRRAVCGQRLGSQRWRD